MTSSTSPFTGLLMLLSLMAMNSCFSLPAKEMRLRDSGFFNTDIPAELSTNKTIAVVLLLSINVENKDFPKFGPKIAGAATYAAEFIKNEKILPLDFTLQLKIRDSKANFVECCKHMTSSNVCEDSTISAFIGPEHFCGNASIIAQARNLPMISYACSDKQAAKFGTFIRLNPSESRILEETLSLLNALRWRRFTILYQKTELPKVQSLLKLAQNSSMKIIYRKEIDKYNEDLINLFWQTKERTRVYVFLGTKSGVHRALRAMAYFNLIKGIGSKYAFVYIENEAFSESTDYFYVKDNDQFDTLKQKDLDFYSNRFIIVSHTPVNQSMAKIFADDVRKYNSQKPFYAPPPNPFFKLYVPLFPASYLYDALVQYAYLLRGIYDQESFKASNATTKKKEELFRELSKNGTLIGSNFANYTYKSVLGYIASLGPDRQNTNGSYRVYIFQTNIKEGVIPFSSYSISDLYDRVEALIDLRRVKDQPEYRPKPQVNYDHKIHTALPFLGTLGMAALVGLVFKYRSWKYRQEALTDNVKIPKSDLINQQLDLCCSSISLNENEDPLSSQSAMVRGYFGKSVHLKDLGVTKNLTFGILFSMRQLKDLKHDNICAFIGVCQEGSRSILVTDFSSRGSLEDILHADDETSLDAIFISSLMQDLIMGLHYLHYIFKHPHGNLKSSNCVVDGRWVLKLTDYGLYDFRHEFLRKVDPESLDEDADIKWTFLKSQLWRSPELLRVKNNFIKSALIQGTRETDVYAFGIILHEIIARKGPYSCKYGSAENLEDLLINVSRGPNSEGKLTRPNLDDLLDQPLGTDEEVRSVMSSCWAENEKDRPDIKTIRFKLKKMRKKGKLVDSIAALLEKHNDELEGRVRTRTYSLYEQKKFTEELLYSMMPPKLVSNLVRNLPVDATDFESVTIYFSDIVGFTLLSASSTAFEIVTFLNDLYSEFDSIIPLFDVYKVETIGDAYMVVSGLPEENEGRHAGEIASMALELLETAKNFKIRHKPNETLRLRIGIHTGPVIAGVVGRTMPRYCLFGDTVNTASRMESNGVPLRIHISKECKEALDRLGGYVTEERGYVEMKGKGSLLTYWLLNASEGAIQKKDRGTQCQKSFLKRYGSDNQSGIFIRGTPRMDKKNLVRKSPLENESLLSADKTLTLQSKAKGGLIPSLKRSFVCDRSSVPDFSQKNTDSKSPVKVTFSLERLPSPLTPILKETKTGSKESSPCTSEPSLTSRVPLKVKFGNLTQDERDAITIEADDSVFRKRAFSATTSKVMKSKVQNFLDRDKWNSIRRSLTGFNK